jgi:hypothetical protein
MSKSIPGSNAGAPEAAAAGVRRLSAVARAHRFRVDEVLHEIGRRGGLSSRGAPIAWGLCGFLIGAIFWHLIGVWGFLGAVVLKAPATADSVVAWQQPVIVARQRAVEPAALPNCTVLVLDRSTGQTTSVSCPEHLPMFEEARRGRQDLAFVQLR